MSALDVAAWGIAAFALYSWWLVYGALRYHRTLPSKHMDQLEYDRQPGLYLFGIGVWLAVAILTSLMFALYLFVTITGRPPFL